MKWKRLKGKIVSFMLIFALLVTGANLPAGSADAQTADTTSDAEKLVFEFTAAGENDGHDGDTNEGIVTKLNGEVVDFYGHDSGDMKDEDGNSHSSGTFFPMKIANQIAKMKRPVYKVTSLTEGATLKFWDFCWNGMWTIGDQNGNITDSYIKDGEFNGTHDVEKTVIAYKLGETEIGIDLSAEYEDGEAPEAPEWNGGTFLGFGLDFGASATIEIYDTGEDIEASQLPETTASATKAPGYIPDGEKLVFEFTAAGENDGHDGDTNEGIVTKLNGEVVDFYGHDSGDMKDEDGNSHSSGTFFPMKIANQIAKMKRPVYKVTSLTEGATLKFWDFCWNGMWTIGDQNGNITDSYIKDGEFNGTHDVEKTVIAYKLGETEIGIDLSAEYEDGEAPEAPEWNGGTFLGFGLDFGASATIEIYDAGEASQLPETTASATKAPGYIPDGEKLVFEFTAAGENDGHDRNTNEGIVTKLNGEVVDFYGHDGDDMMDDDENATSSRTFFPMKIANQIAKMKRPVYKVTSLTKGATLKFWDFCWDGLIVDGDTEGAINSATLKDGIFTYYNIKGTDVNKKDYILGETEIGIDLSAEYEDGEAPEAPEWNGGTFLGFGLDFGASATIEIYDTAEEEIEPSLLPEQSSTPTPPVATPLLKPSFRPAVISTVAPLQTQAPASTVAPLQTQVPASTVAPLPEQSNIPAGVPGSNVTPGQSSVPSVSTTPVPNGQEKDTVLPDDEDDEEDEEEEESLNPIKKITAPKQIVLKKGKTKTVTVKLRSKNKSMKTTDDVSVTAVSKKVKVSGRKYNSQRLTFRVKGKKKGNTVIYVIIGEKSRKIKVICL